LIRVVVQRTFLGLASSRLVSERSHFPEFPVREPGRQVLVLMAYAARNPDVQVTRGAEPIATLEGRKGRVELHGAQFAQFARNRRRPGLGCFAGSRMRSTGSRERVVRVAGL
jgi:hypothetical protein